METPGFTGVSFLNVTVGACYEQLQIPQISVITTPDTLV